jgi:heat shock protein HslJ
VSGHAGCNRFHGRYRSDASTFEIGGPLASTLMLCPPDVMQVEALVLARLGESRAMRLTGQRLVLSDADGTELLVFAPPPADGHVGEWTVLNIHYPEREAIISAGSELSVVIDGSTISGHGGCNNFNGTFLVDGANVRVGPLASTMKWCGEDVMAQESALLSALGAATSLRVENRLLTLLRPDGGIAVTLARR